MKEKIFCIYHSVDFDGICSAKIVEEAHSNHEIVFFPYSYGDSSPVPSILNTAKTQSIKPIVVMVDVCLSINEVEKLFSYFGKQNFIWIDHHKTAIEKMEKAGHSDMLGLRSIEEAACILTYKYFHSTTTDTGILTEPTIPCAIRLIGCMDIWDQTGIYFPWEEVIKPFYTGLESQFNNLKDFPALNHLNSIDFLFFTIERGKAVLKHLELRRKAHSDKSFIFHIDGFRILALNTSQRGSSMLYPIFKPEIHDGVMMFSYDGSITKWTYSLYTTKEGIDLSTIASKRGGGGHAQACGFETISLIDELKTNL